MRARTVGAAGVGVGLLAGWPWGREADVDGAVPAAEDCPACPTVDVAACAEPMREAVDAIAAERARLFGTPVPFPDDLPPEHLPAAFRANLDRALAECDTDLELALVDCDEHPCLAAFEGDSAGGLAGCPAWTDTYGFSAYTAAGSLVTPDGERGWQVYAALAPGAPSDHNQRLRLELRRDAARDQLLALWDGRERTEAEEREARISALQDQLAQLQAWADEGTLPPEHAGPAIEQLERELDALEGAR